MINTKFWDDGYTANLDPIEKLLFLYALTNTSTNICGIYEIPVKKISTETGIEKEMVLKVLQRFADDEKMFYVDGWMVIKNFAKNQNQRSPKVKRGIEIELENVPEKIKRVLGGYPIDTLSHSNTNSNTNLTKLNTAETSSDEVSVLIKSFEMINPASKKFYGNTTQRGACKSLIENYGFDRVQTVIEKTIPKTNTLQFFPVITTPLQLSDKWVALESAIRKYQSEKVGIKNNVAF